MHFLVAVSQFLPPQSASLAHPCATGQRAESASGPPQSLPVSLPFCCPSACVGAWHFCVAHTKLSQSVPAAQPPPTVQRGSWILLPPQSTPVSVPFLILSFGLAGWHILPAQELFTQSVGNVQRLPSPHAGALGPPQSVSVSVPFFTPSVGEGPVHTLWLQAPLKQSPPFAQPLPPTHANAIAPPQSMSVSSPSLMPFFADGGKTTSLLPASTSGVPEEPVSAGPEHAPVTLTAAVPSRPTSSSAPARRWAADAFIELAGERRTGLKGDLGAGVKWDELQAYGELRFTRAKFRVFRAADLLM
jgi:hypothetical protein